MPVVVLDDDRVVGVERDVNVGAEAREGLVHAVVDDLVDEVVQALLAGRADVHTGALTNGLEALEHLDLFSPISP